MAQYFDQINKIAYEGADSTNPLAFKHYNANEVVLGKTMAEHLRMAACYWHNFCWNGQDVFGQPTFNRPWLAAGDAMQQAKHKADVAFEFFQKLGIPYYCFHDIDVAPEGKSIKEYVNNFAAMVDVLEQKQAETGVKLLWGTANLFSNPRYAAGAASNPDPQVFSYGATQVFHGGGQTALELVVVVGVEDVVFAVVLVVQHRVEPGHAAFETRARGCPVFALAIGKGAGAQVGLGDVVRVVPAPAVHEFLHAGPITAGAGAKHAPGGLSLGLFIGQAACQRLGDVDGWRPQSHLGLASRFSQPRSSHHVFRADHHQR